MTDENHDSMNVVILPIFFYLLPKLPLHVHEGMLTDLLTLLKHSDTNRDAFCAVPSLHACLYDIFSYFIVGTDDGDLRCVSTDTLVSELQKYITDVDSKTCLQPQLSSTDSIDSTSGIQSSGLLRRWSSSPNNSVKGSDSSPTEVELNAARLSQTPKDHLDALFAIGMKVYATLLLHSMDFKSGWKDTERALSLGLGKSNHDHECMSVSQSVLSHVVTEMSFSMKSRYKELQRLIKSKLQVENHEGMDKFENVLSLLLMAFQYVLKGEVTSSLGLYHFPVAKLRVRCRNEVYDELQRGSVGGVSVFDRYGSSHDSRGNGSICVSESDLATMTEKRLLSKYEGYQSTASSDIKLDTATSSSGGTECELESKSGELAGSESSSVSTTSTMTSTANELPGEGLIVSFTHWWLSPTSLTPNPVSPPSNVSRASLTTNISTTPRQQNFDFVEHIHPLERNHNFDEGRLVLLLQIIRLFDEVFWPSEATTLRNHHGLRFLRETVNSSTPQAAAGASSGSSLGYGIDSCVSDGVLPGGSMASSHRRLESLTLFSSVMRACLYVHCSLSPLIDLATINVQRLRALFESSEKVRQTPVNTPVDDWLVAAVVHTTAGLQQISVALMPIYSMIGINEKITVSSAGAPLDPISCIHRQETEKKIFDRVLSDDHIQKHLQSIFSNIPGRNLLRYIKASILLLADALEGHSNALERALEPHSLASLQLFIDAFSKAMNNYVEKSNIQQQQQQQQQEQQQQQQQLNQELVSEQKRATSNDQEIEKPVSGFATARIGVSDMFSPTSIDISGYFRRTSDSSAISQAQLSKERSDSLASTDSIESITLEMLAEQQQGLSAEDSEQVPSSAFASTPSPPSKRMSLLQTDNAEGQMIVSFLSILRDPYMWTDLLRSIKIAMSLSALEGHEFECDKVYTNELSSTKLSLDAHRSSWKSLTEEMRDMNELRTLVTSLMCSQEKSRKATKRAVESPQIKRVASQWQDCLQAFQAEK